jgi:hypothetical protein
MSTRLPVPLTHIYVSDSRDLKKARVITTSDFQNEILRRIRKQPAGFHFKWNLDKEHAVQILSLRAAQYYMARENPKFGSRYLLHALVKFETEQVRLASLPLRKRPSDGDALSPSRSTDLTASLSTKYQREHRSGPTGLSQPSPNESQSTSSWRRGSGTTLLGYLGSRNGPLSGSEMMMLLGVDSPL